MKYQRKNENINTRKTESIKEQGLSRSQHEKSTQNLIAEILCATYRMSSCCLIILIHIKQIDQFDIRMIIFEPVQGKVVLKQYHVIVGAVPDQHIALIIKRRVDLVGLQPSWHTFTDWFEHDLHIVFIPHPVLENFILQFTNCSKDIRFGAVMFIQLDGAFLDKLFDSFFKLLGFHDVLGSNVLKLLRRELRKFLIFEQIISFQ